MADQRKVILAILWGVAASLFLSSTFIINSLIAGSGINWAWASALRSIFLIPVLGLAVLFSKHLKPLIKALKHAPVIFMKWGIIGFGLLYTAVAVASLWSPGWMVAATFQINILAGILLAPFIYTDERKFIPRRALMLSIIIIAGVFIMQFEKMHQLHSAVNALLSFFTVLPGGYSLAFRQP